MFKWHRVSIASTRARKKTAPIFTGETICKFSSCKNVCKFSMDSNCKVHLHMNPIVKHHMSEYNARPIRSKARQEKKAMFKHGQKPYKHFLEEVKNTPNDVKLAGNFSNFGNTTRTFQQISHESKYENRLDQAEYESLIKIAEEMREEFPSKTVRGFIQHISVLPPYIMYWTEIGIRIWHDIAKNSVVHWDATGSLLSHRHDNLKYYYYELSCQNPAPGEPLIPVASMISTLHSTPLVRFWLAEFRRAEKRVFGHANASIPSQVTSDRSMVFIQAALSEFNDESLNNFRCRAFRIVTGAALEGDLQGTIPHACLSHVMGSFRRTCFDFYKSNYEFGMFCLSLLLNSSNLTDTKERLHAIFYLLSSKYLDNTALGYLDMLQEKISTIDLDKERLLATSNDNAGECMEDVTDLFIEKENPDFLTEEDFHLRSTKNEFSRMAEEILEKVNDEINSVNTLEGLPENKRYSITFLEKVKKLYLPTLPLWSNVLLGDLSRHGTSDVYKKYTPPSCVVQGNTNIEKRFQILKDISLDGNTTKRLDELSVQLKNHIIPVQEYAILKSVKPGKKLVTRQGRSSKTVEEMWSKGKANKKEERIVGKYQKPPNKAKLDKIIHGSKANKKAVSNKQSATESSEQQEPSQTNPKSVSNTATNWDKEYELFRIDTLFANTTMSLENCRYVHELYRNKVKQLEDINNLEVVKNSCTELENLGNTCWFNSVVQMFSRTKFMHGIDEQFNLSLSFEEDLRTVLDVFNKVGRGVEVTMGLVQVAMLELSTIFGLDPNRQNDVHEFVTTAVRHFMNESNSENVIQAKEVYVCTICGNETGICNQIYCDLQLAIADDVRANEGVKDLLDRYFEDEEVDATCCGGKRWRHVRLTKLPKDLVICIVRHGIRNNRSVKNRKPIHVDRILNMGKYTVEQPDAVYRLMGVIIHHGTSPRNGHYTFVKFDGGSPIEIDDKSFRVFDGKNLETDSYLCHYQQVPRDEDVCHRYIPNVVVALLETKGFEEIMDYLECLNGLSVRKHRIVQLLRQLKMHDESSKHSWEAYNLLQEAIEPAIKQESETSIGCIVNSVLQYFCNNCPSILERHFGMTVISKETCSHCGTAFTNNLYNALVDYRRVKPIGSSLYLEGELCQVCCNNSQCRKETIIHVGSTVVATGYKDFCYPEFNNDTANCYPKATACPSGTILYRNNEENVDIIMVESHDNESGPILHGVSETRQQSDSDFVLFLDKREEKTTQKSNFEIIESETCIHNTTKLSIHLTEAESKMIKVFKAPIHVNGISLTSDDVSRFLHGYFSDNNIDAFCSTLAQTECLIKDAAWFGATLALSDLIKPDSMTSWYDVGSIFIPANYGNNHWILMVVFPKDGTIWYLDPLINPPEMDIINRMCKFLHIQHVFESKNETDITWKVQDVMQSKHYPKQTDMSSCGAMVCLYAKLISEHKVLEEQDFDVPSEQVRMYIMNEVVAVYQHADDKSSFGLKTIIFTTDLDDIVYKIMSGTHHDNSRHDAFMTNAVALKREKLIGYASDFLTVDEYHHIELYLRERYFHSTKQGFTCSMQQSIFSDCVALNKKLKQNFIYADWYCECVLTKEVLLELLSRTQNKPRRQMAKLCEDTEMSYAEIIKGEVKAVREAKKKA